MRFFQLVALLLLVGFAGCGSTHNIKQEEPYTRRNLLEIIKEQVKGKPVLVVEKPVKDKEPAPVDDTDIPICNKSAMPGYGPGEALTAAVEGFNARGADIDNCNKKIQEWVRKKRSQTDKQ